MKLTLARFDPEPVEEGEEPSYWDVSFDVELSDGSRRYSPTTVYRSQIPDTSRVTIIEAADAAVRPGLAILEILLGKQPAPRDWFDNLP